MLCIFTELRTVTAPRNCDRTYVNRCFAIGLTDTCVQDNHIMLRGLVYDINSIEDLSNVVVLGYDGAPIYANDFKKKEYTATIPRHPSEPHRNIRIDRVSPEHGSEVLEWATELLSANMKDSRRYYTKHLEDAKTYDWPDSYALAQSTATQVHIELEHP